MAFPMKRLIPLGLFVCLAGGVRPGAAADVELLPEVGLRLEAARYTPTERDFHFSGWMGAGAGLLRVGSTTAYFDGDIETILGWGRRPFEATQVDYHLEPGLRWPLGPFAGSLFFHHVSRHLVDRDKPEAVDWNVLGVRLSGPAEGAVRVRAGVGHTTQASLVGYRWELTGGVTADLGTAAYVSGDVRYVTVDPDPAFPRGNFADIRAELGGRWRRGGAALVLFAAFERRNDVLLLVPLVKDRLLLGFRILYAGR
jgi:hypothetical protein